MQNKNHFSLKYFFADIVAIAAREQTASLRSARQSCALTETRWKRIHSLVLQHVTNNSFTSVWYKQKLLIPHAAEFLFNKTA